MKRKLIKSLAKH